MQTSASDSRIDFEEQSQLQAAWGLGMHYRISKSPWFVAIDYMNLAKDARFTSLQIGRYFGFNESEAKKSKKAAKIPYENLRLKLDSDQDGVIDQLDHCPLSIRGVEVDENGCCTQKSGCTRIQ
jgi:OOP family OmpA-OmpF porin